MILTIHKTYNFRQGEAATFHIAKQVMWDLKNKNTFAYCTKYWYIYRKYFKR